MCNLDRFSKSQSIYIYIYICKFKNLTAFKLIALLEYILGYFDTIHRKTKYCTVCHYIKMIALLVYICFKTLHYYSGNIPQNELKLAYIQYKYLYKNKLPYYLDQLWVCDCPYKRFTSPEVVQVSNDGSSPRTPRQCSAALDMTSTHQKLSISIRSQK